MSSQLRSLEWLKRLVAFNTVSCFSNLELIEDCKKVLEDLGFECKVFYDDSKTKANMIATIGPQDVPGIILSGHTDVVPVSGQQWDTDPFEIVEKDDKLYGRGTCDMKGFIAVCMAFAKDFASADLKIPVSFALSYDEEVGCAGVYSMTDHVASLEIKPLCCFVGEPTMMRVVNKHKGYQMFEICTRGFECHSSLIHQGVNAVEFASEIVKKLRSMKLQRQNKGPFNEDFVPPFTTIHCGTIHGGEASNIVPKHCSIVGEWRFIPEDNPDDMANELKEYCEELESEMQSVVADTGIEIKLKIKGPALNTAADSQVVSLAQEFSGSNGTLNVSYMTEASIFCEAGVPTVIVGPGSIEQAHKPNEFVLIDQMKQCEGFMFKVLDFVKK